jgi:hypothetical protein
VAALCALALAAGPVAHAAAASSADADAENGTILVQQRGLDGAVALGGCYRVTRPDDPDYNDRFCDNYDHAGTNDGLVTMAELGSPSPARTPRVQRERSRSSPRGSTRRRRTSSDRRSAGTRTLGSNSRASPATGSATTATFGSPTRGFAATPPARTASRSSSTAATSTRFDPTTRATASGSRSQRPTRAERAPQPAPTRQSPSARTDR